MVTTYPDKSIYRRKRKRSFCKTYSLSLTRINLNFCSILNKLIWVSIAYRWQVVYMKDKMTFMKVFDGSYKMEPIYVDSESLCKQRLPKSREEYRKCSGGQGKIASKVTMDQYFQPSSLLNLPPLSWNIRGITIKTTKDLIEDFQYKGISIRGT